MNKKNIFSTIEELFISLCITIFSISICSTFVLFFKQIYYICIPVLHIEENSGFSKDKIISNYDALIHYFSPFVKGRLELPSLHQSMNGIQHFAEVKNIFLTLYAFIPVTLLLLLIYLYRNRRMPKYHFLKTSSIFLSVTPILFATGFLLNFNFTFTLFHKIFFRNNYWIFNSQKDPIIRILPEEFFCLCGIIIILLQFLASFICFLLYQHFTKKNGRISTNY